MCVICIKEPGIKMPKKSLIEDMFWANPDGGGYMFRSGKEIIGRKGFESPEDLLRSIKQDGLTDDDAIIYHFRIATQAPTIKMTQPFPLTYDPYKMESFDWKAAIGVCHNGIIQLTSDPNDVFLSDTANYMLEYMTRLIRDVSDPEDEAVQVLIQQTTKSKWAIMTPYAIVTIGNYIERDGLYFSNDNFKNYGRRCKKSYIME